MLTIIELFFNRPKFICRLNLQSKAIISFSIFVIYVIFNLHKMALNASKKLVTTFFRITTAETSRFRKETKMIMKCPPDHGGLLRAFVCHYTWLNDCLCSLNKRNQWGSTLLFLYINISYLHQVTTNVYQKTSITGLSTFLWIYSFHL